MRHRIWSALALAGAAMPACAGPPYLTDDPVPTDTGHWEVYAFTSGEGTHSTLDADAGFDLNYGAARNLQLTATLPLSFDREPVEGWRSGTGDVELGAKYRVLHDDSHGISVAIFPRAILPTSGLESDERTRILLPVWLGKDFGRGTSLFGGGGYEFNPGPGNRSFWQGAVALTHDIDDRISVGAEVTRQGPETLGGTAETRAGVGSVVKLSRHCVLLLSGGPTWADKRMSYHFYGALGLFL